MLNSKISILEFNFFNVDPPVYYLILFNYFYLFFARINKTVNLKAFLLHRWSIDFVCFVPIL